MKILSIVIIVKAKKVKKFNKIESKTNSKKNSSSNNSILTDKNIVGQEISPHFLKMKFFF